MDLQPIKLFKIQNTQKGFTLVEVMVAIFIGLIVMGMAVAILGATNSTAIRVITKSEVQRNSRDAMLKVMNGAADAESLEICRVGTDRETQDKIQNTLSPKPTGQLGIAVDRCRETASSGIVLAWAYPNQMCYFKTKKTTTDISKDPPKIVCISRGGNGRTQRYSGTPAVGTTVTAGNPIASPHANMNITNCLNFVKPGSSVHEIYQYECSPSLAGVSGAAVSSINWPSSFSAPIPASIFLISDIGSSFTELPETNLFSYILQNQALAHSSGAVVGETALKSIVAAKVSLRGKYNSGVNNETRDYFFEHTLLFRGSELAREESSNE